MEVFKHHRGLSNRVFTWMNLRNHNYVFVLDLCIYQCVTLNMYSCMAK